jgi:hypothetical protein
MARLCFPIRGQMNPRKMPDHNDLRFHRHFLNG